MLTWLPEPAFHGASPSHSGMPFDPMEKLKLYKQNHLVSAVCAVAAMGCFWAPTSKQVWCACLR